MQPKPKQPLEPLPTNRERLISLCLAGILVLIAAGLIGRQSHFDPARWRAQPNTVEPVPAASDQAAPFNRPAESPDHETVAGLQPLGPAEDYGPDSLSDKINGKADLYLSAGFEHLRTRRFALSSDPSRWMERYVYNMGRLRNALAVYSSQRRPDAEWLDWDWTTEAYRSTNGLFFIHGPFYVEIIASEDSSQIRAPMEALARAFTEDHPATVETLPERRLFLSDNQVPGSMLLVPENAFGIENMDWVYTARYSRGQKEATVFISRRDDAQQAARLADAFAGYFLEYGGERVEPGQAVRLPAGAHMVFILDTYQIVMTRGRYLYGVHEADDREQALDLAVDLTRRITEAENE
jgi:hypothetical protein